MHHAKVLEIIVSVLTLIFVFWSTSASQWIIAIAAAVLLLHALFCGCAKHEMSEAKKNRK